MPEFAPGESKTAIAPITVQPAGLSCEAEIFLSPDELTKVATSGRIPFTSTGASQDIRLPITMPDVVGTYPIYLDVFIAGQLIYAYRAIEDVIIAPVAPVIEFDHATILAVNGKPFVETWFDYGTGRYYGRLAEPFVDGLGGARVTWYNKDLVYQGEEGTRAVLFWLDYHIYPWPGESWSTPTYTGTSGLTDVAEREITTIVSSMWEKGYWPAATYDARFIGEIYVGDNRVGLCEFWVKNMVKASRGVQY